MKIKQIKIVICPREKWEIVGGNMNAKIKVTAKSNLGGRLRPELNQTIAISETRLSTHHRLLACWRGKYPKGQKMPIATGIQTALPNSYNTVIL